MKLLLLLAVCLPWISAQDYYFPDDFVFGAATSAFQVEGAWDEGGKGESIWDRATHEHPERFDNHANADVAADSYHKYKEDVQLLKWLGANYYRFSIAWTRILPNGKTGYINQEGIDYYNNLINELLENGIKPHVTMYQWDLPQTLQDEGGWTNRDMIGYFVDYARVLFQHFGDRVKIWTVFNEIREICLLGYDTGEFPPFLEDPGRGGYECAHTVILAYGKTYRMYEKEFKAQQNGRLGNAIDTDWFEPNLDKDTDREASERIMQMGYAWFVNPFVWGDYPQVMKDRIWMRSQEEGLDKSRLPEFTSEEIQMLNGTADFIGLNHYRSDRCWLADPNDGADPSQWRDVGVIQSSPILVGWGLRSNLNWIRTHFRNLPVLITQNGYGDNGELDDTGRVEYLKDYLSEVLKAIHEDGCNVIGYTVWSLIDAFEWTSGYRYRMGLVYVDLDDPNRERKPKTSYNTYRDIISSRHIV